MRKSQPLLFLVVVNQHNRGRTARLRAHDQRLLDVGRLAGTADKRTEAVVGHLDAAIGLVHVAHERLA